MSTEKAISGLHRQARALIGRDVTVKMEDKDYDKVVKIQDVKFNRKPVVTGNEVSLQVRLRFADMRFSDLILKTKIPG